MTAPTTAARRSPSRPAAAPPRPPARHRGRSAAIGLALVLAAAAICWLVGWSPVLAVRSVRVVPAPGEAAVSPAVAAAVVTAADVPTGVPLARVDADAVRARVLALPRVADVEVRRGWPNEVVLAVTERVPVAVVAVPASGADAGGTTPGGAAGSAAGGATAAAATAGGATAGGGTAAGATAAAPATQAWMLVDADGVTFDRVASRPPTLPLVAAPAAALPAAVAVVVSLPDRVAPLVTEVDATTPDDVTLTLEDGSKVRWGSAENSELKGRVLVALLPRRAALVDVSAPLLPTTSRERAPRASDSPNVTASTPAAPAAASSPSPPAPASPASAAPPASGAAPSPSR